MRVTTRMRTGLAGLALLGALAASLSGCVTVHGEEALIPATTEEEAERVVERYLEVKNEANPAHDPELTVTVEGGTMGRINEAGQLARSRVSPEGDPDYTPLAFSDTRYHIPRQAGWPKFFVADTASNRTEARWLLVFTRGGVEEEWFASYLMLLEPGDVPEFTEDEEGYLQTVAPDDGTDLAMSPAEVATAYADYLQTGTGPFADGPRTSGVLERRDAANEDVHVGFQWLDSAPEQAEYAPVALRTEDGALVFFSAEHDEKQTWAEGQTPVVDELVEALLEGSAEQAVTTRTMAMLGATLPAEENTPVSVHSRISGLISAKGE